MCRSTLTILTLVFALGGALRAQSEIYSFAGSADFDWCYGVSNPMQLDADGTPDFVLTCFGLAIAISGQTGEIIYSFMTPEFATDARRIGDIDGDGLDDYIMGQPYFAGSLGYAGYVSVHSGADGTTLFYEFGQDDMDGDGAGDMLGWDVDGCGDVDNDGYPDFIYSGVGDQGLWEPCMQTMDGGFVLIRSGYDGAILKAYTGNPNCDGIGGSTVGLGDIDADGHDDYLIVGYGDLGGINNFVTVRSGIDHSEIRMHTPFLGQEYLGIVAVKLGDVNGDGTPDYGLGSPYNDGSAAFGYDSFLDVFSGADGSLIHPIDFFPYGCGFDDFFGWSVCDMGDLDGDGKDDIAIAAIGDDVAGGTDNGSVFIISGDDATVIQTLFGSFSGQYFGAGLCGPGDLNVDGQQDIIVSSLNSDLLTQEAGMTQLLSLGHLQLTAAPHVISVADGGAINFTLDAGPAQGGNTYFLIGSATGFTPGISTANGVYIPLVQDSYFNGTINPALNPIANWTGLLDILGRANASLTIPAGYLAPQAAGITIYHAFITYDFAAGDFSIASNHVATSFSL